jgi:hypothetical protein
MTIRIRKLPSRRTFTAYEMAVAARAQLVVEERRARRRQLRGAPAARPGRAGEIVARRFGVSWRTLRKALAVVEAAERAPAQFAMLILEMDRGRGIDRAFRFLRG